MTEVGVGLDRLISLRGKRALITGAAAGIGRAIAGRFAEAGASLLLVDIHRDRLSAARGELSESADVEAHAVDVSQREQRDRPWQAIAASYPDILVNNAGIYPFRHFLDMDQALYEEVMAVNLDAVYWMCQEFIRARGDAGGVILNLGSIEALLPFKADLAHYSVSKAGVVALTRALAKEHGGRGFRVNALLPGGIVTEGGRPVASCASSWVSSGRACSSRAGCRSDAQVSQTRSRAWRWPWSPTSAAMSTVRRSQSTAGFWRPEGFAAYIAAMARKHRSSRASRIRSRRAITRLATSIARSTS